MAHVDRKQYVKIFIFLFVLTIVEVGIAYISWLQDRKALMIVSLVILAVYKAFLVLWYFMHLSHDSGPVKGGIMYTFAFPALYAIVLIAEGAWRGPLFQ